MQRFTIETPGGKRLTIEAPDEATAMRGAQEWHAQQQAPKIVGAADPMGSDGVSGDSIRARNAGDTRPQMRTQDIEAAYDVARGRGDASEQRAMADAFVRAERRERPIAATVGDAVRQTARGLPFIGEYTDNAMAAVGALTGGDYRKALDYEHAADRVAQQDRPISTTAAKVAGGIGGTIAALPAATAARAGVFFGAGAKSIPGAVGRGAVAGATQGAAAGYGREGTGEAAIKDAAVGGALGGAIPAALALGKAGFDRVASAVRGPDVLSAVPKKAQRFFMQQFDPASMGKMRSELDALGPQGVLADVSPEMQMIARGAASRPGSRQQIVDVLASRDVGKNARLQTAMDDALGPVTEPSAVRATIKEGKTSLNPVYEEALGQGRAVDTRALASGIDAQIVDARGPVRGALEQARAMLNVYGTKELDPSPRALMEARKALDGMIGSAERSGDMAVMRALTGVRGQLDEALSTAAPGVKAADRQFSELARQGQALDDGATALRSGPDAVRPADLAKTVQEAAVGPVGPSAVPLRLSQGARAELDRIVGSNANDVASLRNLLKGEGDWNRDKLRILFGDRKADQILRVLDNEGRMEATFRTVVGGSQTAPTQGFREFIDEAAKGSKLPEGETAFGMGRSGVRKLIETVTGANKQAKAERFAADLGRLSVSGGDDAQRIIDAILARQGRQQTSARMVETFGRIGGGTGRMDDPAGVKAAIAGALLAREIGRQSASRDQSGAPRR